MKAAHISKISSDTPRIALVCRTIDGVPRVRGRAAIIDGQVSYALRCNS